MSTTFSFPEGPAIEVICSTKQDCIWQAHLTLNKGKGMQLVIEGDYIDPIVFWCRTYTEKKTKTPVLNFDFDGLTPFTFSVLKKINEVPFGRTKTYKDLAKEVGKPPAIRAAGTACGKNPFPLFIPCHRILRSNGGLGGYSEGLEIKKELIRFEGIG